MLNLVRFLFAIAFATAFIACGPEIQKETQFLEIDDFDSYMSPASTPDQLQAAARAVVRVGVVGMSPSGTGFFISEDGRLLTNHHIINGSNCTLEGCFITIDVDLQNDIPYDPANTHTVWAKPIASSEHLDYTVLQISSLHSETNEPVAPFQPAFHLEMSKKTSKQLVGEELYVIGHPMAKMKKVKKVEGYDSTDGFIRMDDYVFGGNSGSPILTADGKFVGILHSGLDSSETISKNGIQGWSKGSSTDQLLTDLAAGSIKSAKESSEKLKKLFLDIDSEEYVIDENPFLLISAGRLPKTERTEGSKSIEMLLERNLQLCEEQIELESNSMADLNRLLSPCFAYSLAFINCEGSHSIQVCPSAELQDKWKAVSARAFDRSLTEFQVHNTNAVQLASQFTAAENVADLKVSKMKAYLDHTQPGLNYELALQLIEMGLGNFAHPSFPSAAESMVRNFRTDKFHSKSLQAIAVAHVLLFKNRTISLAELKSAFHDIFKHRDLTARTSFFLELFAHQNQHLKLRP